MDPWYEENLVCPLEGSPLVLQGNRLVSAAGREYPVVDGVPVLLIDSVTQTQPVIDNSLKRAQGNDEVVDDRAKDLFLETLGISEEEKAGVVELYERGSPKVDPVVSYIVAATSGYAYKHMLGRINTYPIPELPLPEAQSKKRLLDIGCNWGRWSIAATRKGYEVVGLDPSIGAVMAAKRLAATEGLSIRFVVGDARYLPFRSSLFDVTYSYSVLQHFSREDVRKTLSEIRRVLSQDGYSHIQMANRFGVRSFYHQLRRGFEEGEAFEVRYWSPTELISVFEESIGRSRLSVDCYFGLGLQKADREYMPWYLKGVISTSEWLKSISRSLNPLVSVADSVFVRSEKIGRDGRI